MFKLFTCLKKREGMLIVGSLVFIVVQAWLELKIPDYMSEITRLVQTEGSEMADIWKAGGYMVACALGSLAAAITVGFFAARTAGALSKRVRERLFDKVESFSMKEMNQFSTASLITRSTNDITQIQLVVAMGLQVVFKAPIFAVWALMKIYGKSWEWTASMGISVVFLLVVITIIATVAMPKFKVIQALTDNLNRVSRENLTGLRVVRAYNAQEYQEEKFERANAELTSTNLFTNRMMALMSPMMTLIMSSLTLSVYWIGAYLINEADMMDKIGIFSDMVVFSAYAVHVVMAFMMLTMIFILFPRAVVAANRINEVLDTELSIFDGNRIEGLPGRKGEVEFRDVSFRYPDSADYILKDISFKAYQGETIAFIGSTGSGKSTLINLIPRFYDATKGEVLVDGVNVREYRQEALHSKLGYVPQRSILFSGTVSSNVGYAHADNGSVMPEEVRKALDIAQGLDFVDTMEGQLEGRIAQGGSNVSGGQKQRLSIARAIFKRPEIYIFDDSFSALDYKTDRKLRTALRTETERATTFIVAQRIGTIIDADQIIVLDEGQIAGKGTHRELMKTCKVYQEIAYSQLSKEELQ